MLNNNTNLNIIDFKFNLINLINMNRLHLLKNQLSNNNSSNSNNFNTTFTTVESSKIDPTIKIVTFSNPPLNSLGLESTNGLFETLCKLDDDKNTRVIIITGKGKAFAAGADIKRMSKMNYPEMSQIRSFIFNIEKISYQINKPLIAAVNGFCFGGGFELALSCDMIIASDKSAFSFPELNLGLFPGAGGTQRLARLMGQNKAMEYILSCKNIPLNELKQYGVVNDVVSHDALIEKSVEFAKKISKYSLTSVAAAKKAIKIAQESGMYAGLRAEKFLFDGIFNTEDKQIGIEAFMNKKTATFKDK